ncbi:cyclase family protein [Brevibacillus nitrificans]|uniref:cyclase family protein n=1 Tax=Brevibacillus nitrificans TaxID=651560 RepID=UPI00285D0E47|nr:cyclase family protein [Brevibacillus nitrificans]MDR7314387.1 kynurenine formamidase [Brevibacillus nitrificans]
MTRKTRRMIDLSVMLDPVAKEPSPPDIRYGDHESGAVHAAQLFGLQPSDFPESKAWANETVTLTTHTGTHVDAPWHYWPTSEGKPSKTVDQLPLEWFYSDGVLLDFSDKPQGYEITVSDIQQKLEEIQYTLKPFDIVLIRSDADKRFYEENYFQSHAGVSAEATHWLIDQGIKVMGTDGWGWDIPFSLQAADFKQNPREGVLWAAHFVGKEKEYCQIEKLANLDQLPKPYGFTVAVFPIKVKGASAGWARPVAIIEE